MGQVRTIFRGSGPAATVVLLWMGLSAVPRAQADMVSPGLTVAMRRDDPGATGIGSPAEWIGGFQPQLLLERLAPIASWNIEAHRRYDSYQEARRPRMSSDVVIGTATSQFAEHSDVTLEGRYFHSRDLIHPDPESPLTSTETWYGSGSARATFWRGEASYRTQARSYSDPGLGDAHSRSVSATLIPLRSEQQMWTVSGRRDDWTTNGETDLRTSVATLGFRRQHTPLVSSELQVGAARVEDDLLGGRRNEVAFVAALNGLGHVLRLPFDANLRVTRDVSTAGSVDAWSSVGGVGLALHAERSVDAEGGLFHETTRRDYVSAVAQDTLSGRTVVSLEGSYRRARSRTVSTTQLETYRAAAAVSRELNPWLMGGVRYALAGQTGSGDARVPDVDRNRVEIYFTAAYR